MTEPIVLYEVDDKVGIITLNRPDKLNAISAELQHALLEAFAGRRRPATSVVLLRAMAAAFAPATISGRRRPGDRRLAQQPDQGARASASAARIRDGAVANEKAGRRRGAGPCAGRRLRAGHAVRPDDRRRQRDFRRARGAVFQRRPGDRDADDHRLQEGARAALFRRPDRRPDGAVARHDQPRRAARRVARRRACATRSGCR